MTYSMKFDLGGLEFGITSDTVDALMEEYSQLEGDPTWFLAKVQEVVPMIEKGDYVSTVKRGVGGTVVSDTVNEDASADTGGAWDNYIEDTPAQSSGGSGGRQHSDPWDDEPVQEKPSQRRSAPSRPAANTRPTRPANQEAADAPFTESDKFGRQWTVGLPDAPNCDCGEPAARMKAKAKGSGKPYTVFKCAKGAPGGAWQEKCDYSEFPN